MGSEKKKIKIVPLGLEPGTSCTGSEALTIRLQCMTIHDMASVFSLLISKLKVKIKIPALTSF